MISMIREIAEIEVHEEPILHDISYLVKVANNLKRFAKSSNPAIIREAIKLEKYKKDAVKTINEFRRKGIISDEKASKYINLVYEIYHKAIEEAEKNLEVCFRR